MPAPKKAKAPDKSPVTISADAGTADLYAETITEVRRLLMPLCVAASTPDGDPKAGAALVSLAASLCSDVVGFACTHQAAADDVARKRNNWPILCDIHPEYLARNLRWLKVLPLGEAGTWKKTGRKSYSFRTPANEAVLHSMLLMKGELTLDRLVGHAERRVMADQAHPLRAKGKQWAQAKSIGKPGDASFESNVRSRVRELLRAAARQMLNLPLK